MTLPEEAALRLLREDGHCQADPLVHAYLSLTGVPLVEVLAHCVRALAARQADSFDRYLKLLERKAPTVTLNPTPEQQAALLKALADVRRSARIIIPETTAEPQPDAVVKESAP